jgi:hypothetical protein
MVFDADTGEQLFYDGTSDVDFYVSNVWLEGDLLIFTTDMGLLYDCILPVQRNKECDPARQPN